MHRLTGMFKGLNSLRASRVVRSCFVAFLVIATLWSANVAVASATMGCCDSQMACCTLAGGTGCNTCVPALNVPVELLAWQSLESTPSQLTALPERPVYLGIQDIWRPPKSS